MVTKLELFKEEMEPAKELYMNEIKEFAKNYEFLGEMTLEEDPDIDYSLNLTLNVPQKRTVNVAVNNTFGFGGHNSCLIFKKF